MSKINVKEVVVFIAKIVAALSVVVTFEVAIGLMEDKMNETIDSIIKN